MGISPMKENMLRALARYKYLTASQIVFLGISTSTKKVNDYFRELRNDRWFTTRQIHYSISKKSKEQETAIKPRYEDLHCLTHKGAKFLDSYTELYLGQIQFPKDPTTYLKNGYLNRVSTIYSHISFDNRVRKNDFLNVKNLQYYFHDKNSKQKRFKSETLIKLRDGSTYTPDAIYSFQKPTGESFIFIWEIYTGDKARYPLEQLEKLFWIIDNTRKIEQRIGVKAIPRILCALDNEALMEKVIEGVKANPIFHVEGIEELIFFGVDREFWEDFGKRWINLIDKKFI